MKAQQEQPEERRIGKSRGNRKLSPKLRRNRRLNSIVMVLFPQL